MDQGNLFLRACRGEGVERPPIWLMRQAGRYQPEYRELRKKHSFLELCQTPELAAQVSLIPFRYFPADAAIIFSDLLVPLLAMGVEIEYRDGGPEIHSPLRSPDGIRKLSSATFSTDQTPIASAIRQLRLHLPPETPIIGFAGAPYTLASYLVEGGGSSHFSHIKEMIYSHPMPYTLLCQKLVAAIADFLSVQIEAGTHAVQIFDTWAGHLSPEDYRNHALPPLQRLIERVKGRHPSVPVIYYVNGIAHLIADAAQSGADVLSCDWRANLEEVRKRIPRTIALQGNLDPALLLGSLENLASRAQALLNQMAPGGRYIFNLGHGILPSTPVESAQFLVKLVRDWQRG
ncbi:MAG: uroporphyrinogen decarboxylase [Deltaproteobacteria bacterium]|nr:uroporphyrinogen decarboxylase [Deltaproteobacteria bacterium]